MNVSDEMLKIIRTALTDFSKRELLSTVEVENVLLDLHQLALLMKESE